MSVGTRWVLVVGCLLATTLVSAQATRPLRGRTVQSVVDELREGGAPLVYSSNLLSGALTVAAEPTAAEPLALVREILLPHGLVVREEAGVWLIVRGEESPPPTPGGIAVIATAAYAGSPIAEFTVQLDPPTGATVAAVDGRVVLSGLPPGRRTLRVTAPAFLPERVTLGVDAGATPGSW
jgi:hypothetical protein